MTCAPFVTFQVDDNAALTLVGCQIEAAFLTQVFGGCVAGVVTPGRLDVDYVGPHLAQKFAREGTRQHVAGVDDAGPL